MTKPKPKTTQLSIRGDSPAIAAGQWPKAKEERICNSTSAKPYTAPELRPFTGRQGSLDALACPSLQGGRLVYRGSKA